MESPHPVKCASHSTQGYHPQGSVFPFHRLGVAGHEKASPHRRGHQKQDSCALVDFVLVSFYFYSFRDVHVVSFIASLVVDILTRPLLLPSSF